MELILGMALTLMVTPVLIWAANSYGLLDHPDARKQHEEAIPLVGGVAMFFAIAVSSTWFLSDADMFWGLLAALSIIVGVGFLDDWVELSVRVRFLGQSIAALVMALFAGAHLAHLGDLLGLGTVALGAFTVPFTVFAVVGMANALNFSDGLDGLAGGLALIATVFVASAAYFAGSHDTLIALLILGGALIGFLFFNMRFPWQRRARVFMGDSGSLMLGFLLAWAIIRVTQGGRDALPPAAALWFFAIPLWDTVSLMLRRVLKGRSPCHPGRDHLHHILLRVGYTDGQVVGFIHLAAVVCGLIGFFGWQLGVPDAVMLYAFLAVFALYCCGVQHAWKLMRLVFRLKQPQA